MSHTIHSTYKEQMEETKKTLRKIAFAKLERERRSLENEVYKKDWRKFQDFFLEHGITSLYHFTDRANISSIKAHGGLLSLKYCNTNNISISKSGSCHDSRNIDEKKNIDNYIKLSFVREHPMLFYATNIGRIDDPIILEINPRVIFFKLTRFSLQNAAAYKVNTKTSFNKFKEIKFNLFHRNYNTLDRKEKSFFQAEILVYEKILIEDILNIDGAEKLPKINTKSFEKIVMADGNIFYI